MLENRTALALSLVALLGVAACGGGEEVDEDAEVTREVITQPSTETVEIEVPTVDTAVVERVVDVDTSVQVDTIQNPDVERRDPR